MRELIKITEQNGNHLVSARELHSFFESTERFSRWFDSILKYGFVENVDYTSVKDSTLVNNGAKRTVANYALTLEMAKEIAMIQRNEKGKQARQYFIEVERKYKSLATPQYNLPASYKEALLQLVERIEQNEQLENQVKELAPKAEYTDKVLRSSTKITTTLIAKELGVSARKLNTKLHELKVQYKQGSNWVLYSKYDNMGFVDYYTYAVTKFNGEVETRQQMMWTESGRNFIHHLLKNSQLAH